MANIKSAKKRIRTIEKKTARNIRVKNHVSEAEKAFLAAVKTGDVAEAEKAFKHAERSSCRLLLRVLSTRIPLREQFRDSQRDLTISRRVSKTHPSPQHIDVQRIS